MSERINHPPGEHPRWCNPKLHIHASEHRAEVGSVTSNGLYVGVVLVGEGGEPVIRVHLDSLNEPLRAFELHLYAAEHLAEVIATLDAQALKRLGEALETGAAILGSGR